jgi:alpha-beta hydrolase superfamily lysophospholipase
MELVTFSSDGRSLSGALFEASRPGPAAVVLCHGAFEFKENWFDYAERLAGEGFTALTFDLTGHGESDGVRGTVDMGTWPYDIREALNLLGTRGYERFGLVGWDFGGTAVVLAAAHDPRVRCAAILSAPVFLMPSLADRVAFTLILGAGKVKRALWRKPLTLSRAKELERMRVAVDEEVNERYRSDARVRAHYEAVPIPECLDHAWIDVTPAAERVEVPTLIVHGAKDVVHPVAQSQRLRDALQATNELHVVEGVGHAVHLDGRSDEVYELIAGWMRRYLK